MQEVTVESFSLVRAVLNLRNSRLIDMQGFCKFHLGYPDGAILDEIQRAPDLLSYLQVLIDAAPRPGLYILTGSQQFEVMNRISQSLAGRTALLKLLPFSMEELAAGQTLPAIDHLLLTGFQPHDL